VSSVERRTGLLIIGGGIMGAGLAKQVRDQNPDTEITMIDTGPRIGPINGQHLHDTDDEELWLQYNAKASAGIQALYIGAETTANIGPTVVGATPGMYHLSAFGESAAELPAAAVGWNGGGMGIHWTAATPWPYGPEVFDFGGPIEWDADLATAQRLLRVNPDPYGPSAAGAAVAARLSAVFDAVSDPGRKVQPMPMAINPHPSGLLTRSGPNAIFPPISDHSDARFHFITDSLCMRVLHDDNVASGAILSNLITGEQTTVWADAIAVCADAMRTPQLLWASGIRPPALGRFLNEHAFVSGRVIVDIDRVRIDLAGLELPIRGEWCVGSYWLPRSGSAQPFQGQIMNSLIFDSDLRTPIGYSVGLSWYIPTEIREENRIEFSDSESDAAGLPKMTVRFSYSEHDAHTIDAGLQSQRLAGEALGDFNPQTDSALLPPGSSLHYTGTVRMGRGNDGTSVCNPAGRVWGFDNLFVAGNGVVPTALTANSTLAGMITVARASRGIIDSLERKTVGTGSESVHP
jgi:hypothetical protein